MYVPATSVKQLPPDAASGVLAAAGDAFTDAMGIGLAVGAALAAVIVVCLLSSPRREPVAVEAGA